MKVISTNISEPREVIWKGKKVKTGIFKHPTEGIYLEKEDVRNDAVVDRKYHGGVDKACYLFTHDIYEDWQQRYPESDWTLGMFGENLTVEGLDEREIFVGDIYKIGDALVEVSEFREPCFKLGLRFGTQKVLKEFINQPHCGVYVRVLKPGEVKVGDEIVLQKRVQDQFSLSRVYWLRYHAKRKDIKEAKQTLKIEQLASSAKRGIRKKLATLGVLFA